MFIHVIQSCSQDSSPVVLMMQLMLKTLRWLNTVLEDLSTCSLSQRLIKMLTADEPILGMHEVGFVKSSVSMAMEKIKCDKKNYFFPFCRKSAH